MTEHYGIFLDGLIVVLLVATIFYAVALSRRLSSLRDNRKEMEVAVRRFVEASTRADASIKGLKRTADESGTSLQSLADRAQTLRDELAFLVDSAEAVAERLEAQTGVPRPRPRRTEAARPDAAAAAGDRALDRAEDSPLTASRGAAEAAPAARPAPRPAAQPAAEDRDSKTHADLLRAIENLR
ncbi:MAG: hypothetical protein H6843_08150 [Rhodospirillaceae bacterium]|nr:hypothetical protein [Rhodospirillaceae bacterium]